MKKLLLFTFSLFCYCCINAQNTITISGQVTDYEGNPIDSCYIELSYNNFTAAYSCHTDKQGFYSLENVKVGKYMAMHALRLKEYPRANQVPDDDKRLEFWAWNIIADRDLAINPKYHRLELYGTNAYKVEGGYPGLFIYTRPMSTGKLLSYSKEIQLNKTLAEEVADISVKPEHFKVKVYIDDKEIKVNSIQPVTEYVGNNKPMGAFLIQTELPKEKTDKPYLRIRVVAENTEEGEKGENIIFYELKNYQKAPK